jgi:parallel beta-helix repeat protein
VARIGSRSAALAVVVVAVAALFAASPAEAATFTYPSGACPAGATGLNDCINNAGDGDHISVKAGFYNEIASVPHAVTVSGPCTGKPAIIDATGFGNAFTIAHDDVTLKCLRVQNGSGRAISNAASAFQNLHVMKIKATHFAYGIFFDGGSGMVVKGSTFSSMSQDAIRGDGPSINSTIKSNTIKNAAGWCVILNGAVTTTISKNNIGPCGVDGVYIQGGTGNTIATNKVHTVNNNGFAISSISTTLSGNTVRGASNDGFYSDGKDNVFLSNKVTGATTGEGFELSSSGLTVKNNKVTKGATFDGIICSACDGATISGNSIAGEVGSDGINASGFGVTISANSVTGGAHGSGISVTGDFPTVNNNVATGGFGDPGIRFHCLATCANASLQNNVESGSYDDVGYLVTTLSDCAVFPCTPIKNNKASDNMGDGFLLNATNNVISGNTSNATGWGPAGCSSGFRIESNGNQLTSNIATGSACDGFYVDGSTNTFSKNTGSNNDQMGFHVKQTSNKFDHNTARNNTGDGFNNDGTSTDFTNNKASGNRQDCTNDATVEAASTGTVTGNACGDGVAFTADSTLNDID